MVHAEQERVDRGPRWRRVPRSAGRDRSRWGQPIPHRGDLYVPTAEFTTIQATADGGAATSTLDRPAKLNPLCSTTLLEMVAVAHWFDTHPAVKVVVVLGRVGRSRPAWTCRRSATPPAPGRSPPRGADTGRLMAGAIEAMRVVTVAANPRPVRRRGVVLPAVACDLRVAARTRPTSRSPRSSWASRSRGAASCLVRDRPGPDQGARADVPSVPPDEAQASGSSTASSPPRWSGPPPRSWPTG